MKLSLMFIGIIGVMSGIGYWYYTDTQERMAILQENNAQLNIAVEVNEQTIDALQADYAKIQATNEELNKEFAQIRRQNAVLSDKLSKHDLGVLGSNKPGLVERVINNASKKAGRCFELLSGAELTDGEQNAKTAKAFNSECPWLFDTLVVDKRVQSVDNASTEN